MTELLIGWIKEAQIGGIESSREYTEGHPDF